MLLSHFSEMRLSGGAAGYELGFGGTLSRDAKAKVEAGLSGVEIEIPASTAARVIAETTLGSVDVGDGFTERQGALLPEDTLSGDAPVLTIRAGVRLGSLQLRARYPANLAGCLPTLAVELTSPRNQGNSDYLR